MGRASISIAITSNFNPKGVDAAIAKMEKLAVQATSLHGKYGKGLVDAGADLGVAASRLEQWGRAVAGVGDKLTMGVTVPMGIAAGAAVMAATQIDTAWYNVRKTVDMTEEGYRRLKQSAMDLAATQPVSAETILNIESLGGQLGISTGYLEDFAKVVSGLDIATNMDADTAATELAQFRNIVQMSEDDLDNWASTVVDLGNHTATTEADMVNLAMRFASAGRIAGMSNAEILGMSAALSGLGMKAEAGGSAISRTINDINNSVARGGEGLEMWADLVGKAPQEFADSWRAAPMDQFLEVLQHINEAGSDMGAVLDELGITQIRQSDAMRRLASSGEYVSEVVERANSAWERNTALTQEVEKRNQSLESQFKTIGNRLVNTAATFGEPLADMILKTLDALDPLVDGVGDAANAFASADPTVQQFAFNLGLVAAAAGPVMSVTGRLMQVAGAYGKRIARATQQYGVFTEAVKTNDAALIRDYAAQDTLATRMGLTRNAAVKAAGGIDQMKRNLEVATPIIRADAENAKRAEIYTSAYSDAVRNGATSHQEASKAAAKEVGTKKNLNRVTKAGEEAVRGMTAEQANAVAASERGQAALERQGDAAQKASTKLTGLKAVLLGIGGIAATAAIGAGITWMVTQLNEAAEKTEQFRRATRGLEDAVRSTGSALGGEAGGKTLGEYAQNVEQLRVRQGELGDTIRETNAKASAQVSEMTRAWQTIERYANQSGLGAAEHYQLERAIEAVNEACGTQYTVMDDGTNRIQDETGAILDNTDAIRDNIEKRKQLIQVEAIESNLEGLYSQREETLREIGDLYREHGDELQRDAEIQSRNAEIVRQMNALTDANGRIIEGNEQRYSALANELAHNNSQMSEFAQVHAEAKQQLDSVNDAIGYEERRLEEATGAAQGLGNSIRQWLTSEGWEAFNEGFGTSARDLTLFSKACEDAGITVEQLGSLSEETVRNMITGFTGTKESIENALQSTRDGRQLLAELGIAVDSFLAQFEGSARFTEPFDRMGRDLTDFAAKCQEAGINFESLNGLGSDQIAQLASNFDGSVQSIIDTLGTLGPAGQAILSNLADNWAASFDEPTQGLIDSIVRAGEYTKVELQALASQFEIEGGNATRAFMEALDEGLNPKQAADLVHRIEEEFGSVDPERAREAARRFIEAFRNGISDADALSSAINALKSALGQVDFTEQGSHARSTWFAGFNSGGGSGNPLEPFTTTLTDHLDTVRNTVNEKGEITGEDWSLSMGEGIESQAPSIPPALRNAIAGLDPVLLDAVTRAYASGSDTSGSYGQGVTDNSGSVSGAGMSVIGLLMSALFGGVGQAAGVGSDTGQGYGDAVAAQGHVAEAAAVNTLGKLLIVWLLGIASAQKAGERTGTGYAQSLAQNAQKAVTAAQAISIATGTAFGAGRSQAAAAGSSLGAAFASAVWTSGGQAIAYARSIRSSVKSIFDDMPTANIKVKVTRTVTTAPASFGGHPVQYASLPSQTPVMPVPDLGVSRAATVAERAVQRVSGARSASPSPSGAGGVAAAIHAVAQSAPAVDYDTMYRVVKSGVSAAIRESGGLMPVVELDGRVVSRQLAQRMDYELGRLDRMRG